MSNTLSEMMLAAAQASYTVNGAVVRKNGVGVKYR